MINMVDYYFERLNNHVISIDLEEGKLRQLWTKYLSETPRPDFTDWCVLLAKRGIKFFYYEKNPEKYIKV